MAHKTKSIEENMTRFAELVGRGNTQPVAARAVGVSPSLGEKWMRLPEIRDLVESTKAKIGVRTDDLDLLDQMLQDPGPKIRIAALTIKQRAGLLNLGEKEKQGFDVPEGAYVVWKTKPRPDTAGTLPALRDVSAGHDAEREPRRPRNGCAGGAGLMSDGWIIVGRGGAQTGRERDLVSVRATNVYPDPTRLAITVSMMPYCFASSAVMK